MQKDLDAEYFNKIPGLKPNYVKNILGQLEKFEEENKYTDSQLSIKLLSENFGTNYVYLSKLINEYKGKNFNVYINDLRLEYAVELLKNKRYLNVDIKDLSALAGFSTPYNFSSNFVRKYKIKPSYFIKLLKEKA
ncbi:helix-turn-helix domain-containing protein [Frigoriflavimonas asaccharolytica]|uniref:AraC-like DNA-binding protein n=1 Tax=Frigoriflavimonas asaccharolytica TaxID=2735899 RepID=A0A8J8KCX7_9FLAO|nr:AraC family transcriptional regulator [Frigoriflavimonas asaccharolytica]NRS94129.1 AraC-like DNA-binding protein [Frigoriflavimonas asaccharolytica]